MDAAPNQTARTVADMLADDNWEKTKRLFDAQPEFRRSMQQFLLAVAEDIEAARRTLGGRILRGYSEESNENSV